MTRWIKSSYSGQTDNCVELASTFDEIRDSKDPHGPTLHVNVRALVRAVQDGRFE